MKTHKLIRKLREAIAEERNAAENFAWWQSSRTEVSYDDAKAETDKHIERIEKLLGTSGTVARGIVENSHGRPPAPDLGGSAGAPLASFVINGPAIPNAQMPAEVERIVARSAGRIGA